MVYDIAPYDIPFRSIISKDIDNLLAPGSSGSCDLVTWSAIRYCTTSVTTGQAAGTAAALAAKSGVNVRSMNVKQLQRTLNEQGLITSNKQINPEVSEQYKLRKETWTKGLKL
jgi:hypothetical protein